MIDHRVHPVVDDDRLMHHHEGGNRHPCLAVDADEVADGLEDHLREGHRSHVPLARFLQELRIEMLLEVLQIMASVEALFHVFLVS